MRKQLLNHKPKENKLKHISIEMCFLLYKFTIRKIHKY